jgi:regulator of RNase E activity RraA/CMP-N-acetylneuraminic acid synthetase
MDKRVPSSFLSNSEQIDDDNKVALILDSVKVVNSLCVFKLKWLYMKVVAFLPAKGTSSRIPNKNVQLLDGKPLFLHSLEKLVACDFIDEVYLDTECDAVADLASELDCYVLRRSPDLASNKTDGNRLFMNEVDSVEADIYIQMLCTSPFIDPETIRKGIDKVASKKFDSAVLVRRDKQYQWNDNGPIYDIENIPNSVDLEDSVIETMGLYIVSSDAARRTQRRIGDLPYQLEASPIEAIDVNWPEDFELANLMAAGIREKDRKLLSNIKTHITSSILSDILDDLGVNGVLKGFKGNIDGVSAIGRAKTLKIRKLNADEDYRGIYKALKSYESIVPNDIILVENEVSDCAYFGELNANLAIRSGATAAIIGGMTRDTREVFDLGFPVFSKGQTCQDVRRRATLESINKTIDMDGVKVSPNDLVYADQDGVVVVPRKYEKEVIKRVFEIASNEKSILVDIAKGVDVESLTEQHGFF